MHGQDGERRKHKRIDSVFIVTFRIKKPFEVIVQEGFDEHAAVAMDISQGGMGLDVDHVIPVGAEVRLRFEIENQLVAAEKDRKRRIDVDAESRYCQSTAQKRFRVGVLFKNISQADQDFIAKYVRDNELLENR